MLLSCSFIQGIFCRDVGHNMGTDCSNIKTKGSHLKQYYLMGECEALEMLICVIGVFVWLLVQYKPGLKHTVYC